MNRRRSFCCLLLTGLGLLVGNRAEAQPAIVQHERWVTSLLFSADGNLLYSGGGESLQYRPGDVKIWDTKTGNLVAALEGQTSNIWGLAISADGTRLVSSAYDGKINLWNLADASSWVPSKSERVGAGL